MINLLQRAPLEPLLRDVPSEATAQAMKALGEVNRLRVYALLSMGPMSVGDLGITLGLSQALVSHHLAVLKAAGLIVDYRSPSDARVVIYSIDKSRLRDLYGELSLILDPIRAFDPRPSLPDPMRRTTMSGPIRVLFLCTGNSARSQMSEALLREKGEGLFQAVSAGTHPKGLHPLTIKVMDERGIDVRDQRSKDVTEFLTDTFDYVITVCDRANEECPVFPGDYERIHWSFEDPAAATGSEERQLEVFRRVRIAIENRIALFINAHRREAAERMAAMP
ncbi:MAG: metalloregulator ArsR/SmtB family transcription factor [Anaerolineae bacterium]